MDIASFDPLFEFLSPTLSFEDLKCVYNRFCTYEMYKNDIRFVVIATELALMTGEFQQMFNSGIGTKCAWFYKQWSLYFESQNLMYDAIRVIKIGIVQNAEPIEMLTTTNDSLPETKNLEEEVATESKKFEIYQDSDSSCDLSKTSVYYAEQEDLPKSLQYMKDRMAEFGEMRAFEPFSWKPVQLLDSTDKIEQYTNLIGPQYHNIVDILYENCDM